MHPVDTNVESFEARIIMFLSPFISLSLSRCRRPPKPPFSGPRCGATTMFFPSPSNEIAPCSPVRTHDVGAPGSHNGRRSTSVRSTSFPLFCVRRVQRRPTPTHFPLLPISPQRPQRYAPQCPSPLRRFPSSHSSFFFSYFLGCVSALCVPACRAEAREKGPFTSGWEQNQKALTSRAPQQQSQSCQWKPFPTVVC